MITKSKEVYALRALQNVLIRGRTMAYEKADYSKITDLLDTAEHLAALMYDKDDMTNVFRENLVELAKKHQCNLALDEFDRQVS